MVLNENNWEVIEACQRGEQDAFAVLYDVHSDKVYSIALRYAGNEAAAMDIAQDRFLKLLSRIGQFRSDAKFDTWLYRLVVNSCLDYQRRKRRLLPIPDSVRDAMCTVQDTILHDLLRQERQDAVHQMVGKLPPEQRIVVILRYMEVWMLAVASVVVSVMAVAWGHYPGTRAHFRSDQASLVREWIQNRTGIDIPLAAQPDSRIEMIGASVMDSGVVEVRYRAAGRDALLMVGQTAAGGPHGHIEAIDRATTASWTDGRHAFLLSVHRPGDMQVACLVCHVEAKI